VWGGGAVCRNHASLHIKEVSRLLAPHLMAEVGNAYGHADALDAALARESENGRIARLLIKLGFLNERPPDVRCVALLGIFAPAPCACVFGGGGGVCVHRHCVAQGVGRAGAALALHECDADHTYLPATHHHQPACPPRHATPSPEPACLLVCPAQQTGVTWAETASQQLLKMFRDYVFHQCDEEGSPVLDLGHVIDSLNRVCLRWRPYTPLRNRRRRSLELPVYPPTRTLSVP
jgi:hypothetical protein